MYWMDTGWYPIVNNDWVYTGNWAVDTAPFRFPNGMSEFMDYGKQNYGMDMLVWIRAGTRDAGNRTVQHDGLSADAAEQHRPLALRQ